MTYFPIKDLKRAIYNPRIMPDKEMTALMRSIETHGFVEPIVVNINKERYGIIVGGHQRLTAIEKLITKDVAIAGIVYEGEWKIPAFEVDLTLEAEQQLNIGLNKIHGKFDEDKIYELISGMQHSPTLPSTGFDPEEIAAILSRGEGEGSGTKDEENSVCTRCDELRSTVDGHVKRSGHLIFKKVDNQG